MADITDLIGYTGRIGREDVQFGKGDETFSVPTSTGGTVPLTKLPSPDASTYSILKGVYYPKLGVTDHAAAGQTGSLAAVLSDIGVTSADVEMPSGDLPVANTVAIPSNVRLRMQKGAIFSGAGAITFSGNLSIHAGQYQIFNGPTLTFQDGQRVHSSWFSNLATAITAMSGVSGEIVVDPGTHTLTADYTGANYSGLKLIVSSGATITFSGSRTIDAQVRVKDGGLLNVATGVLTLNGNIEAGQYKIFSGAETSVNVAIPAVDLTWFGGSTSAVDNSVALSMAMNALPVTGGVVDVYGWFSFTQGVAIPDIPDVGGASAVKGITFRGANASPAQGLGDGSGADLGSGLLYTGTSGVFIDARGSATDARWAGGGLIGIALVGAFTDGDTSIGLHCHDAQAPIFKRATIKGFGSANLRIDGYWYYSSCTDCSFTYSKGDGVFLEDALVNQVTFTRCRIGNNAGNGISKAKFFATGTGIHFNGCWIESNGTAFRLWGVRTVTFDNCYFEANTNFGDVRMLSGTEGTLSFQNCWIHLEDISAALGVVEDSTVILRSNRIFSETSVPFLDPLTSPCRALISHYNRNEGVTLVPLSDAAPDATALSLDIEDCDLLADYMGDPLYRSYTYLAAAEGSRTLTARMNFDLLRPSYDSATSAYFDFRRTSTADLSFRYGRFTPTTGGLDSYWHYDGGLGLQDSMHLNHATGVLTVTGSYSPFTGSHVFLLDGPGDIGDAVKVTDPNEFNVVRRVETEKEEFKWCTVSGRAALGTSGGVIVGIILSKHIIPSGECLVHVGAVGDNRSGLCNGFSVCEEGGPISAGTLLVASSTPGRLMAQADDIVRASTVGKSAENVTFDAAGLADGIYGFLMCG